MRQAAGASASGNVRTMILAVVRHAQSVENADKYAGFYQNQRPYSGTAAHDISRRVVGLTPLGFRESLWLKDSLAEIVGSAPLVYTSTYRRAIDTAAIAFPHLSKEQCQQSELLDEQHYGDATYMTKSELFATYSDHADERRYRKHLWVPPGGGESLADGVWNRAEKFVILTREQLRSHHNVVAVTHNTTILALRAILERRSIIDMVNEARKEKTPTAGILHYELEEEGAQFQLLGLSIPLPL